MDDPWDVKSVRQSGQYTSCMKLNGVPLLPPVLSKECRKEMQYYKLLAKEVEKRISILKPYIDSDSNASEDTDAPEIPECYLDYEQKNQSIQDDLDPNINQIAAIKAKEKSLDETLITSPLKTELNSLASTNMAFDTSESLPPYLVGFSLNIKETGGKIKANTRSDSPSPPIEVPERDCDCVNNRELLKDHEKTNTCKCGTKKKEIIEEILNFSFAVVKDKFAVDSFHDIVDQDGPQSLGCKSFTGSLNNIHTESIKSFHAPNLVRQRSYTILNPSPQLMAHLEVQSVNLGVDMSCISMSESLSNLSTPNKKRRSWDLESAKVKWANMALELKKKNLPNPNNTTNKSVVKVVTKRAVSPQHAPRAKAVAAARNKYANLSKQIPKTELVTKGRTSSPVRCASNKTIILEEPMTFRTGKEPTSAKSVKESTSPKTLNHKKEAHEPVTPKTVKDLAKNSNYYKELQSMTTVFQAMTPKSLLNFQSDNPTPQDREGHKSTKPQLSSDSEDPATKVRELYDKIQKQQLVQMASLIEKQKKEQIMLQQVFEEQNNLLFRQLKTICPKSPVEVKAAWVDKAPETDRGPVSLSQLINPQSSEQPLDSPVTSTLTDANKEILNQCDSALKKSRDISAVIKMEKGPTQNGTKIQSPKSQNEGSLTRTNSPNPKGTPTSRRLIYDTSVSTERDYDPILTDRTNDTMADLNVTFPSDSEEYRPLSHNSADRTCRQSVTMKHASTTPQSTDSAIKCMEQTIKNSMRMSRPMCKKLVNYQPTPKQQASASKIVAHVKGYLVRRLMKTARVQSTVQTIKDALLCALQLHQDREGIRGADVDLHRRLIQQITAACYTLHDTFIASTPGERCAMIAADRGRRASLASRSSSKNRHSDIQQ